MTIKLPLVYYREISFEFRKYQKTSRKTLTILKVQGGLGFLEGLVTLSPKTCASYVMNTIFQSPSANTLLSELNSLFDQKTLAAAV